MQTVRTFFWPRRIASRRVFRFSSYSCMYCLRHFGTLIASILFPYAIAICFDCCCRFFAVMMQSAQCRCKTVMATWNCTYKGNPQKTRRKEKKKKKKTVCARPLKCRELLYYTELWKYFCDILSLNYSFHSISFRFNLCIFFAFSRWVGNFTTHLAKFHLNVYVDWSVL